MKNISKLRSLLRLAGFGGLLVFIPLTSQAFPKYLVDMIKLYPGARLVKGCNICHTVGKEYTPYGNDFLRLKEQIGSENMPKVWYELGRLDSDNDGIDNNTELQRGRSPGEGDGN